MSEETYISTTDAAEQLGITRQRVLQLIEAGRLPAKLFANVYMIRRDDLQKVEARTPGRPPNASPAIEKRATGDSRAKEKASSKRGGKR